MSNPGPAVQTTVNTQTVLAPIQNPQSNASPGPIQGTNARRLLAVGRAVNLGTATGIDTPLPIINSLSYVVEEVILANGQVSGAAAAITTAEASIYMAAAAAGTAIVSATAGTAAFASMTLAASTIQATVTASLTHLALTAQTLYVHLDVSLANATCDVFVYGVDLT